MWKFMSGVLVGLLLTVAGCAIISGFGAAKTVYDVTSPPENTQNRVVDTEKVEYPWWVLPEPDYLKKPTVKCDCEGHTL